MTQYDEQANKFLSRFGLTYKVRYLRHEENENWNDGKCRGVYQFTIKRANTTKSVAGSGQQPIFTGKFWQSLANDGQDPSAYDVLSSLSGDINCPDNFSDFCADFGYDEDSRKAERLFKICDKFSRRLRAFFTEEEREVLAEIR